MGSVAEEWEVASPARAPGAGWTERGRRWRNEDAFLADPELGLYAVADGIGGRPGGDLASRVVVEELAAFFRRLRERTTPGSFQGGLFDYVDLGIHMARHELVRRAVGGLELMGTTLAMLFVSGRRAAIAHIGDSRVYRLRRGVLQQLTQDHNMYSEAVAAGLRHASGGKNILTRSICGMRADHADIAVVELEPGDTFLLCTDGLNLLPHAEIERVLLSHDPEDASEALVRAAFEAGSRDNITAVVVGGALGSVARETLRV